MKSPSKVTWFERLLQCTLYSWLNSELHTKRCTYPEVNENKFSLTNAYLNHLVMQGSFQSLNSINGFLCALVLSLELADPNWQLICQHINFLCDFAYEPAVLWVQRTVAAPLPCTTEKFLIISRIHFFLFQFLDYSFISCGSLLTFGCLAGNSTEWKPKHDSFWPLCFVKTWWPSQLHSHSCV